MKRTNILERAVYGDITEMGRNHLLKTNRNTHLVTRLSDGSPFIKRMGANDYEVKFGFGWDEYRVISCTYQRVSMGKHSANLFIHHEKMWITLSEHVRLNRGRLTDINMETTPVKVDFLPERELWRNVVRQHKEFVYRNTTKECLTWRVSDGEQLQNEKPSGMLMTCSQVPGGYLGYNQEDGQLCMHVISSMCDMATDYFSLARDDIASIMEYERDLDGHIDRLFIAMRAKPR